MLAGCGMLDCATFWQCHCTCDRTTNLCDGAADPDVLEQASMTALAGVRLTQSLPFA